MALKGDFYNIYSDPHSRCFDVAAKGKFVCYGGAGSGAVTGFTGGSGNALDDTGGFQRCQLASNPSGLIPFGILRTDVVSVDLTRYHLNFHKLDEVQVGSKVNVGRKGWWYTNCISGTPKSSDKAYLTSNGEVTPTNGGLAATPLVGEFMTAKDEDGYAKVWVNL